MDRESTTSASQKMLLDIHDVAAILGVHWRTVEVLVARAEFDPPLRIGRLRKWHRRTIDNWLNRKAGFSGSGEDGQGGRGKDVGPVPGGRRRGRPSKADQVRRGT